MLKRGAQICWFDYMAIYYHLDSKDFVFNYPEKASAGMVKGYLFVEIVVMEQYAYILVSSRKGASNMSRYPVPGKLHRGKATDSSRPGVERPSPKSSADILA